MNRFEHLISGGKLGLYDNLTDKEYNFDENGLFGIIDLLNDNTRNFPVNAEPLKAPYLVDLTKYFVMTDDIYYNRSQISALEDHVPSAEILAKGYYGDYQGDVYCIFDLADRIMLYRDFYGSCSGCDNLDGLSIEETNKQVLYTLREGNILQFWNLDHAEAYCRAGSPDRYNYWDYSKPFIKKLFEDARKMGL